MPVARFVPSRPPQRWRWLALGLALAALPLRAADEPKPPAAPTAADQVKPDDPAYWVKQLGAAKAKDRKEAEERLLAMGLRARTAVKAALTADDPEVQERARAIFEELRWNVVPGARDDTAKLLPLAEAGGISPEQWQQFITKHQGPTLFLLVELWREEKTREAASVGWREYLGRVPVAAFAAAWPQLDAADQQMARGLFDVPTQADDAHHRLRYLIAIGEYDAAVRAAAGTWQTGFRPDYLTAEALRAIVRGNRQQAVWEQAGAQLFGEQAAPRRVALVQFYVRLADRLRAMDKVAALLKIAKLDEAEPEVLDALLETLAELKAQDLLATVAAVRADPVCQYWALRGATPAADFRLSAEQWVKLAAAADTEEKAMLLGARLEEDGAAHAAAAYELVGQRDPPNSRADVQARLRLGSLLAQQGDFAKGADQLDAALALLKQGAVQGFSAEHLERVAGQFRERANTPEAPFLAALERAGHCYRRHDLPGAIREAEQATKLQPQDVRGWQTLFQFCKAANQFRRLPEIGKQFLALKVENAPNRLGAAYVLADLLQAQRAVPLLAPRMAELDNEDDEDDDPPSLEATAYVFERLGEFERAAAALEQFRQQPGRGERGEPLRALGTVYAKLGRLADADAAYEAALAENPADDYARVWQSLMRQRRKVDDRAAVGTYIKERCFKGDEWARQLLRFCAGELTAAQLMAAAPQGVDEELGRGQECEAQFVIGQSLLAKGEPAAAREAFQKCLSYGITVFIEHVWAMTELGLIRQVAPKDGE